MIALSTLLASVAALAACQTAERGQSAPFQATPAPDTYEPPEVAAGEPAAEPAAGGVQRMHGRDAWPCQGHPVCDERPPADGTLVTTGGGATSIDPSLAQETEGFLVIQNVFEPLLVPGPTTGPPQPGMAERWEESEDGLTYTFHLREGAKWSNGRQVTAQDFVYSWLRKLDPATASPSAEQLKYLKNAVAFNEGRITDRAQVGVEAVDDLTLKVTLQDPVPFFLQYVMTPHYAPVPREAVEAHGPRWTDPETIVVNGPYTVQEMLLRDRTTLVKNPTYWAADTVRIPRVRIVHTESESQALTRYEVGEVHWSRTPPPPERISEFIESGRPDFFIDPYLCFYYYAMRMDKPPFDDVRIRRAVNMAIDKTALVQHVTRGKQQPADGPVLPFFDTAMAYPGQRGDAFDPARARELLAEAGYPQGVGLPTVTLVYNTYEAHKLIAEFAQRSLKENLGIDVVLENMEWKSFLSRTQQGDFQMARSAWCGLSDPYSFLMLFESDSVQNYAGFKSDEFDRLSKGSLAVRDHGERMRRLARAEALVLRDMPVAPLYYYTKSYLKKPYLRGFEPEMSDTHLVRYMYWAE